MSRLHSFVLVIATLTVFALADAVRGQDPDPPKQTKRDPFGGDRARGGRVEVLPALELGAVVLVEGRKPAAILIVSGEQHVVTVASRVEVQVDRQGRARIGEARQASYRRVPLIVSSIDRNGVTLEAGEEEVVVR